MEQHSTVTTTEFSKGVNSVTHKMLVCTNSMCKPNHRKTSKVFNRDTGEYAIDRLVHNMQSTMLGKAHCSPLATASLSSSGVVAAPTERMESYKKIMHMNITSKQ